MKRFFVFSLGSVAGAIIDFIVALGLLRLGLAPWISLACAMAISASVVYVIHQKITFADLHSDELHSGRMIAFLTNTALIYVFRLAVFEGLTALGWTTAIALATALVASVVINFITSRMIIFTRIGRGK